MMMMLFTLFALLSSSAAVIPSLKGSFTCGEKPAFVHVQDDTLYFTSFTGNPFSSGSISRVANISAALKSGLSSIATEKLVDAHGLKWPNEMTPSPFPRMPGFFFGDGFLVPGKSTGSVSYFNSDTTTVTQVTASKRDWFYHKVLFYDMDGDGTLDIVTARGKKPLFGKGSGQLLWLKNTGSTFPWPENVLSSGPDITISIRNGTLYAAEFFGEALTSFKLPNGSRQVIDDTIGPVYDVKPIGASSLYVTNYSPKNGSLFLYNGAGDRKTVRTGFRNIQHSPGAGAPGFVYPFNNNGADISLSGDGSEELYFFSNNTLVQTEKLAATVGGQWIGEINGITHIFVCAYDISKIFIYTAE